MACRHQVRLETRSPSICTIMDEASSIDDDDDSIAGRCVVSDVDDSERALVRDLLVPLMIMMLLMMNASGLEEWATH